MDRKERMEQISAHVKEIEKLIEGDDELSMILVVGNTNGNIADDFESHSMTHGAPVVLTMSLWSTMDSNDQLKVIVEAAVECMAADNPGEEVPND